MRRNKFLLRSMAMTLALLMMSTDALAVVKEVTVYGARSINDYGHSDNRITMDELKDDFQDFVQTDSLREYFHRDQEEPFKYNLDEALSWLIDNEIICRDSDVSITVANKSTAVPVITLSKENASKLLERPVHRSDFLMYLYKSIYGPIDARTLAVETANIRIDTGKTGYAGTEDALLNIMNHNNYSTQLYNELHGIATLENGKPGGVNGGIKGEDGKDAKLAEKDGKILTSEYFNDATDWRYTPQGDEFNSLFGDTNIFISQNEFTQNGGVAGAGGNAAAGDASASANVGRDGSAVATGGTAQAAEGGEGGSQDNTIYYETDYKQIYYVPGADLWFYRTNDALEPYIRAALSRGLLTGDPTIETEKFKATFYTPETVRDDNAPTWSSRRPAYVVNGLSFNKYTVAQPQNDAHQNSSGSLVYTLRLANGATEDVGILGVNFNVCKHGNTVSIDRVDLFSRDSGYFTSESMSKMDAYRYIYNFVYAKEKKLSVLETDIINYKYGMELEGAALDDDIQVLKYLIAKGILNFDTGVDYTNVYSPISWAELIPVLYRAAKRDARLDFTQIQLTDSDKQWKAMGYAPQTLAFIDTDAFSKTKFVEADVIDQGGIVASASFDGSGSILASVGNPIGTVVVSTIFSDGFKAVGLGDQSSKFTANMTMGTLSVAGMSLNIEGAYVVNGAASNPQKFLTNLEDLLKAVFTYSDDVEQQKLRFKYAFTNNLFVAGLVASYNGVLTKTDGNGRNYSKILEDFAINGKAVFSKDEVASIQSRMQMYNQGGKDGYSNITFIKVAGKGGSNCNSEMYTASSVPDFVCKNLLGVAFRYETGEETRSGANRYYILRDCCTLDYDYGNGSLSGSPSYNATNFVEISTNSAKDNAVSEYLRTGDTKKDSINSAGFVICQYIDPSITLTQTELKALETKFSSSLGNLCLEVAVAGGNTVTQYVSDDNNNSSFISWSSLEAKSREGKISVTKPYDRLLINTATGTRALFTEEVGYRYALVGTDIVEGDPSLGVFYKDTNGNLFYHINAIRLLVNAKEENNIAIGGSHSMSVPSDSMLLKNLCTIPVEDGTATEKYSVSGARFLIIEENANFDHSNPMIVGPSGGCNIGSNAMLGNDKVFADYVALSQANKYVNVLSRRVDSTKGTYYAVLFFDSDDMSKIGASSVDSNTSLQGLLDAAVKPPADAEQAERYEANKKMCNDLANFIYKTTGKTYVLNGYLVPDLKIYRMPGCDEVNDSALNELKKKYPDNVDLSPGRTLTEKTKGKVINFAQKPSAYFATTGPNSGTLNAVDDKASYSVSSDYRVIVAANRVYINIACIKSLKSVSNGLNEYVHGKPFANLRVLTSSTVGHSFTVGSTFRIQDMPVFLSGEMGTQTYTEPRGMITNISSNGNVTAQVGPIYGLPVRQSTNSGSSNYLIDVSKGNLAGTAWGEVLASNTLNSALADSWDTRRQVQYAIQKTFGVEGTKGKAKIDITPLASPSAYGLEDKTPLIETANFSNMTIYRNTKGEKVSGGNPVTVSDSQTLAQALDGWKLTEHYKGGGKYAACYITITFDALKFSVLNGFLVRQNANASDFLNAGAFYNVNDMLIDTMFMSVLDAVPLNSVDVGSVIKIGNGYYVALADESRKSEDGNGEYSRRFVGYALLDNGRVSMQSNATIQYACHSFANHFITANNQPVNISHFFYGTKILNRSASGPVKGDKYSEVRKEDEAKALDTLVKAKFLSDTDQKYELDNVGNSVVIGNTVSEPQSYSTYTAMRLQFYDGLMAYEVGNLDDGVKEYAICNVADTAFSGYLSDIPFLADETLDARFVRPTAGNVTVNFRIFTGDVDILNDVRNQFQKAFEGDLFTLVRLLMFVYLIWMFVCVWIIYVMREGKLMPILEAIKYPTDRNDKAGIDIFKIISLGKFNIDTEYTLGRVIIYDLIIAALLVVVWKSEALPSVVTKLFG